MPIREAPRGGWRFRGEIMLSPAAPLHQRCLGMGCRSAFKHRIETTAKYTHSNPKRSPAAQRYHEPTREFSQTMIANLDPWPQACSPSPLSGCSSRVAAGLTRHLRWPSIASADTGVPRGPPPPALTQSHGSDGRCRTALLRCFPTQNTFLTGLFLYSNGA